MNFTGRVRVQDGASKPLASSSLLFVFKLSFCLFEGSQGSTPRKPVRDAEPVREAKFKVKLAEG